MGGVKVDPAKQLAESSKQLSQELLGMFKEERGRGMELISPLIERSQRLISGQPGETMSVLAPEIASLEQGYRAARQSIFEGTEPGAARQLALSGLEQQRAAQIGGLKSGITQQAYNTLAQVGSNLASFGLQEAGAGLQSMDIARATYGDIMQAQAARKASTMGFLGDLVRSAGTVAGMRLGR
jgi:hypothetical protein